MLCLHCNEKWLTVDFYVDVACLNAHPVAEILLDPRESELFETVYSLRDHSKRGPCPFCMPGSASALIVV